MAGLDARTIFERTAALVGDAVFDFQDATAPGVKDGPRDACFRADPPRLTATMLRLRDEPDLRFDFLQNLTAVDWLKRGTIEIVYHLFSYSHRHAACVKVDLPRDAPSVPTVSLIWPTANWLEREQYDLLGVVFEGHPDLRRLLMPDDWVGHPMRKDFHEPKSYRGMPTSRPSPMELLVTYDRAHVAKASAPAPAAPTSSSTSTSPSPSASGSLAAGDPQKISPGGGPTGDDP